VRNIDLDISLEEEEYKRMSWSTTAGDILRRQGTTPNPNAFSVEVKLLNQCLLPANNANPQVYVEATPCSLTAGFGDGTWLFGCIYNGLAHCENDMTNNLNRWSTDWPALLPYAYSSRGLVLTWMTDTFCRHRC
jgi:hypothetical protein